ncbi:MAG TPA: prolipoprotein diacylglyceryl transferase [Myxococcales bacterium]|nr:prolipoprotein diacylglyceryl transferase [Myxococcales bacterium]
MIPWFVIPPLQLGPLAIQPFGVLAAAGVFLAGKLLAREAERRGLDPLPLEKAAGWALIGGIVGAHLVHVLFYHPEELREGGPLQIFKFWDGLSSTGGVIGGLLAILLFFHRKRLRFSTYADVFALAVAPGWMVARLGCFSVHDHPGVLTSFPLAVAFPNGARHDLGLYDAIALGAFSVILHALDRRGRMRHRLLPLLAILYGTSRFLLDFLRAQDLPYTDARYLGLTPAQFACVVLVIWGLWKIGSFRRPAPA